MPLGETPPPQGSCHFKDDHWCAHELDVKLNGGETITLHSYENMGVAVFAMTLDPSNEAAVRRVADHVQQLGVFRR